MKKIPIRFWIAVMIFLTTYINYTTRVNLAVSIIAMTKGKSKKTPECIILEQEKKEKQKMLEDPFYRTTRKNESSVLPDYGPRYDWDETVQGNILGAYFYGYVVSSLPGGAPSEWWGPRQVIFWMQFLTMIFNAACVPAAWFNYWLLITLRFFLGIFAGFIYPALQATIASWAPPAEKGKFVAALMGNTLATCLTWPLLGYVTSVFGWDWGFYVISMQVGIFCVIWWFVVADDPANQKCITKEEVDFITEAQAGKVTHKKRRAPWKRMLLSRPFWMLAILHSGNIWGLYLQLQGVPKFMAEVIGFNLKEAGFLSALPHLVRLFLGLGFGAIGDFFKQRQVCATVVIRKSFVMVSHVIPGLLLIGIVFTGCDWVPVLTLLVLSMSLNGGVVMTNLQNPQDLAPNFAGTIFGLIGCIAGVNGFLGPVVTAQLIKDHNGIKEWGWNFIIGGSAYIGSGLIFILLGSTEEQPWNKIEE